MNKLCQKVDHSVRDLWSDKQLTVVRVGHNLFQKVPINNWYFSTYGIS